MSHFEILYSERAHDDISSVHDYIEKQCLAPLTAQRYTAGLIRQVNRLKTGADSLQPDWGISRRWGYIVRRINYKGMAIIYSIEGDYVIVHRIIAQSLIK